MVLELVDGTTTLIDNEDFEKVKKYRWRGSTGGYVRTSWGGKNNYHEVRLHRLIMDAPDGIEVDHINRNPRDNRKSNLRLCDRKQNKANTGIISTNTSGYKGVSLHKGKWQASIRIDGRLRYLGRYETKEEAAKAYDMVAFEVWGEFASLNKPDDRFTGES